MLKLHQRFRSDNHNVFTEEINKIALSDSNDKGIQYKRMFFMLYDQISLYDCLDFTWAICRLELFLSQL